MTAFLLVPPSAKCQSLPPDKMGLPYSGEILKVHRPTTQLALLDGVSRFSPVCIAAEIFVGEVEENRT